VRPASDFLSRRHGGTEVKSFVLARCVVRQPRENQRREEREREREREKRKEEKRRESEGEEKQGARR